MQAAAGLPLQRLWRAVSADAFDSRLWGDEMVVYVHATGETHALNAAVTATVLTLLDEPTQGLTLQQCLSRMGSDEAGGDAEPGDLQLLNEAIESLARIGLIESLSP